MLSYEQKILKQKAMILNLNFELDKVKKELEELKKLNSDLSKKIPADEL